MISRFSVVQKLYFYTCIIRYMSITMDFSTIELEQVKYIFSIQAIANHDK